MIICHDELCTICGQCKMICPKEAIDGWQFPKIIYEKCTDCLKCIDYCPADAMEKVED